MSWATKYLGLPHVPLSRCGNQLDCWGLLARVYRDELGIELPLFDGVHPCQTERAEIDALLQAGRAAAPWRVVDTPEPFDALLFRRGLHAGHVGVVIDARLMLHSDHGGAVITDYRDQPWSKRLIGVHRHEAAQ